MGYKMKEPSIIGGTQKHTDAIEAQRSASINVQKANCKCGKETCNCGVAPTKHFVDDVPSHNDGHSDNLQTPKEHKSRKSKRDKFNDAETKAEKRKAKKKTSKKNK